MIIGLFGSLASLASVGSWTMASRTFLSQALALFCVLGLLLFPLRVYQRFLGINAFETFLFNVMGVGPLIFSTLLWVNLLFHDPAEEEVHQIKERGFIGQMLNPVFEFELEGNAFEEFPAYRRFQVKPEELERLKKAEKVRYRTAKGALGYRVMLEREPLH